MQKINNVSLYCKKYMKKNSEKGNKTDVLIQRKRLMKYYDPCNTGEHGRIKHLTGPNPINPDGK